MVKGSSRYTNTTIDNQALTIPAGGNLTTQSTGASSIPASHINLDAPHNYLNLPIKFDFGSNNTIVLLYDGLGNKLRKTVKTAGATTLTQDYLDGIELKNNTVEAVYNEEGRAFNNGGTFRYEFALRDHLGNTRVVFTDKNNSGSIDNTEILSETHYYPFGKSFDGAWYNDATAGKYRYLYNGKELSEEFDLNFYDYGARWLDPGLGSWWEVDPLAEKYYHDSPYVYAGNNPIVNIDPNGMDWYKTTDGTMQYDPKIKSKKDVGEGQSYVGRTYNDKTDNGTVNYRKDGSIMYSNQTDAYNRIASNSTAGGTHEEAAVILKNGVLVLPSYDNNSTTADPGKYGYKFEGGNLVDAVDGKTKELVAMVHTHPDKGGEASPSYLNLGGGSDASFGGRNIPGKMNFVFGHDNYLRGITADRATGSLRYSMFIRADFQNIRVSEVLKGQRINLRYYGQQFKYVAPNSRK